MKKLPTIILIVGAIALFIWGFPIIKDRDFSKKTEPIFQSKTTGDQESQPASNQSSFDQNASVQQQTDIGNDEQPKNTAPDNSLIKITTDICDNQCDKFKADKTKLEYCQQVCGFSPAQSETNESDCPSKSGLNKDYCLKDLAVDKNDSNICEQIKDTSIKKTCQNRIIENILESRN